MTLFVIYLFKSASTDSPSNKQANENNWMSKGSCRFIAPGHKHQGQGNSTCLFCLLCKQVLYSWPKPLFSGLKKIGLTTDEIMFLTCQKVLLVLDWLTYTHLVVMIITIQKISRKLTSLYWCCCFLSSKI